MADVLAGASSSTQIEKIKSYCQLISSNSEYLSESKDSFLDTLKFLFDVWALKGGEWCVDGEEFNKIKSFLGYPIDYFDSLKPPAEVVR
jgi:hypothetical protein